MDLRQYFAPGKPRRRLMMTFLGVLTCAMSVGMFKQAGFGTDPFQCLCNGLDRVIPIDFGTLYLCINLVLLVVVFLMDRHYIGVATFINLFLLGYLIDFSQKTLHSVFGDPSMALRIVYITIGIVVMCLGSALYFAASLGVSTYDAVALVWSERQTRLPFQLCRVVTDSVCVIAGIVLCRLSGMDAAQIFGAVGIGTVITAFCMGPLIAFFNRTVARPLLSISAEAPQK